MGKQTGEDKRLMPAEQLVEQLKSGNEQEVSRLLDELAGNREFNLFNELGRLTRDLHEAINAFHGDTRIAELAESEIPDAKERLKYVIDMTEQAANRTLDKVEESIPIAQSIQASSSELSQKWELFCDRKMSLDEFKNLSGEIKDFLDTTHQQSGQLYDAMSVVLMAQDYQDLTGQMIRRVITLVQTVEDNLVGLIKISGLASTTKDKLAGKVDELEGPQLKPEERDDVVSDQDDVDDLLSGLGF